MLRILVLLKTNNIREAYARAQKIFGTLQTVTGVKLLLFFSFSRSMNENVDSYSRGLMQIARVELFFTYRFARWKVMSMFLCN